MAKTKDDLEAVRGVVAALEGFNAEDQERIIRWAREKLGLASSSRALQERPSTQASIGPHPAEPAQGRERAEARKDLKAFVAEKQPRSDVQFATTVAYFYRFEAPEEQRKSEVDSATLQDACRLVDRNRLKKPGQTLRNAKNMGLLDSGSKPGKFTINTVGENLVAMTLPRKMDRLGTARKARKEGRKPVESK